MSILTNAIDFTAFSPKTLDTSGVLIVDAILTTVTSFSGTSDTLSTITPQFGYTLDGGTIIILKAAAGHTITIDAAGTNIVLGANIVLVGNNDDTAILFYDNAGDTWSDFAASVSSADIPWASPGPIGGAIANTGAFTQLTVNDAAADLDSRFEGITDANLIYTDAGNDRVGIGTNTPNGKLHVMTASAGAVTVNVAADDLVVENSSGGGISILTPDVSNASLFFGSPSDDDHAKIVANYSTGLMLIYSGATENLRLAATAIVVNETGADMNLRVEGDTDAQLLVTDASADAVGIGIALPAGKLHVNQTNATGAIPPLYLQQADVDQEMMTFSCTIGVGNGIEAKGAKTLTPTHFIKINVVGVGDIYLQGGTIA